LLKTIVDGAVICAEIGARDKSALDIPEQLF
jgi:hypothetical protein